MPRADVRVGDMHALPWDDGFDVVTSFRGIWGTTPDVLAEVRRVLRPGRPRRDDRLGPRQGVAGRVGAAAVPAGRAGRRSRNQAAMVRARPARRGEELLARAGFVDVRRVDVPFAWEFADPESYARALASTGPAYEAIQAVGEDGVPRPRGRAGERAGA